MVEANGKRGTMATLPYVGTPLKRIEDPPLINGQGRFMDDINLPGMVHAVILHSQHAHDRLRNIDTSRARNAPGVLAVFTGPDMAAINPLPCAWQAGGVPNNVNTPRVLAM